MIESIVLLAVLATAVLSGVLGMAGGMVLMAVLVSVLPVAAAMVLHGATQAASNGARVLFLRRHVMWAVLAPYLIGGAATTTLFALVGFVPDAGLVLILVGAAPWLARAVPSLRGLDIRNRATAVACGATVTAAQLLAGASGPLLDAFYLSTDVDPRRIVATKAATQTIGHVVKAGYYAVVAGWALDATDLDNQSCLIATAILLAVVGAHRYRATAPPRHHSVSPYHDRRGTCGRCRVCGQGCARPRGRRLARSRQSILAGSSATR